jgi:hypothetical protein
MEEEGVMEGEGEGMMEGEGMVVLGHHYRPSALIIQEWGVIVGRVHSPFVGG